MNEQIKILCVDDEKNVLRSLKRLFVDDGYEIITAISGDEGLKLLENSQPIQIVISDYRMPQMNGVDFLKEVYEKWPDTVRIVLSGYADISVIVGAINEGHIYKFIPKPWNDEELKVTIITALESYFIKKKNIQLTRELEEKNRELQELNNNLEKLVEKRTADLKLNIKILTASQNILNSLPVGVIGMDLEGLIVQCNEMGLKLFGIGDEKIVGLDRRDMLPGEVNEFIEDVNGSGIHSANLVNPDITIKGVYMKHNNQEGIILVFDKTDVFGFKSS